MKPSVYLLIWQSSQEAVSYRDKVFNEIYIYIYTSISFYTYIDSYIWIQTNWKALFDEHFPVLLEKLIYLFS